MHKFLLQFILFQDKFTVYVCLFLGSDILEFLEAYPSYNSETTKKSRSVSRCDVHPDTIKTAVYIKHLFMVSIYLEIARFQYSNLILWCITALLIVYSFLTLFPLQKIVRGEFQLKQRITQQTSHWHDGHSCEYFYTCAIDTNNVQRVLNGCRSLIIQNHLRKFGII